MPYTSSRAYTWAEVLEQCNVRELHEPFPLELLELREAPMKREEHVGAMFMVPKRQYESHIRELPYYLWGPAMKPHWTRRGSENTAYYLSRVVGDKERQLELLVCALDHERGEGMRGDWSELPLVASEAAMKLSKFFRDQQDDWGWHHRERGATLDFPGHNYEAPVDAVKCARLLYAFAGYLTLNFALVTLKAEAP